MDWSYGKKSRMARVPAPLRPIALLGRNLLRLRPTKYSFSAGGVQTNHNLGFRDRPDFQKAYARAVKASGWDFGTPIRIHQALWCARQARNVPGDVMELGTGRGFTMSAVLEDWPEWADSGKALHLFDTFLQSWPDETGQQDPDLADPHYAISAEATGANFKSWPNVHLHVGNVFDTLPGNIPDKIAFVHLDLNHAGAETFVMRELWPRISPTGIVLLDDYAYQSHEKQYDAMNVVAAELGFDILTTVAGQGIIIKR